MNSLSNSLPTPALVTPSTISPSASFSNTLQSGGFATIRASGDFTRAAGDGTSKAKAVISPNDMTNFISYDAATNTYALNFTNSSGQASQQLFDPQPADRQVTVFADGNPDPTEVRYQRQDCYFSGCFSEDYLITHAGSGSFAYTYTAVAMVQDRRDPAIGLATVRNDLAVFGMPTPTSAVPRTGSATYALDLLSSSYTGSGSGSVNFGAGTYDFSGTINQVIGASTNTGTFQSSGKLASGSSGFSGTVDLSVARSYASGIPGVTTTENYAYRGRIGGSFFGPAAQELGGAFVAPATSFTSTAGSISEPPPVYGAILGHR
ncbi:HupA family protein [Rhizorhabdus argentea]|uniref:hypothetical protein n=1 Tax=Rhizorhabdus argentea TaxID=1387174 RepID=UPI0030EFA15C